MTRITTRPGDKADLLALHPEGLPHTCRIIAVCDGDKTIGVCGVMHGQQLHAFSYISDELREYPAAIYRAGVKLVELMGRYNAPILAEADKTQRRSAEFLLRLGFREIGEWKGQRLFIWEK